MPRILRNEMRRAFLALTLALAVGPPAGCGGTGSAVGPSGPMTIAPGAANGLGSIRVGRSFRQQTDGGEACILGIDIMNVSALCVGRLDLVFDGQASGQLVAEMVPSGSSPPGGSLQPGESARVFGVVTWSSTQGDRSTPTCRQVNTIAFTLNRQLSSVAADPC